MAQLAKTTYKAGPEDSLAVKDVYKDTSDAVLNSYQEVFSSLGNIDKLTSSLQGQLQNALSQALSNIKLPNGLGNLSQLQSAKVGGLGNLSSLGSSAQLRNALQNSFASMGSISSAVSSINSVISQTNSTAGGLQSAITGGLNQLLGGNISALRQLATTVTKMPSSFSQIARRVNAELTSLERSLGINKPTDRNIRDSLSQMPDSVSRQFRNTKLPEITRVNTAGSTSTIQTQNPESIKPIVEMINQVFQHESDNGTIEVQRPGQRAELIASVTHLANSQGMSRAFNHIANIVKDPEVLEMAGSAIVRQALVDRDYKAIDSVCDTDAVKTLKKHIPDVVPLAASSVQYEKTLAEQEWSKRYLSQKQTFGKIDPNWNIYSRNGKGICNAAVLGSNFAICDYIRASINELMSPLGYKANIQRVYSGSNQSTSVIDEIADLANKTITDNPKPPVVSEDTLVKYSLEKMTIELDKGKLAEFDFSLEPFMLLAPMYAEDSVDECLKRDWPEWYQSLDQTPLEPMGFY